MVLLHQTLAGILFLFAVIGVFTGLDKLLPDQLLITVSLAIGIVFALVQVQMYLDGFINQD